MQNQHMAKQFSRIAHRYENAAFLHKEVGHRLLERLQFLQCTHSFILDLGSANGILSRAISTTTQCHIISLDISLNLLENARSLSLSNKFIQNQYLCGDLQHIPLAANCRDLVLSNFGLFWCQDLLSVFKEINRVLVGGGTFLFTIFGPDTLKELRQCVQILDNHGKHVKEFLDMHDIGDLLTQSGFEDVVMDVDHISLEYHSILDMIEDIKDIGAHFVINNSDYIFNRQLTRKNLALEYEKFRTDSHAFPVTIEVVFGLAKSKRTPKEIEITYKE